MQRKCSKYATISFSVHEHVNTPKLQRGHYARMERPIRERPNRGLQQWVHHRKAAQEPPRVELPHPTTKLQNADTAQEETFNKIPKYVLTTHFGTESGPSFSAAGKRKSDLDFEESPRKQRKTSS